MSSAVLTVFQKDNPVCLIEDKVANESHAAPIRNTLQNIAQIISDILVVPSVVIIAFDGDMRYVEANIGQNAHDIEVHGLIEEEVVRRGRVVEISDITTSSCQTGRWHTIADGGASFYAALPFPTGAARPSGALCIIGHAPRSLATSERDLLRRLGDVASALLHSEHAQPAQHHLISLLQNDLAKDHMQVEALAQFKDLFDRASTLSKIGTWQRSLDGFDVTWSASMFDIFEIPEGSVPSFDDIYAFYPLGTREAIDELVRKTFEANGKACFLETTMTTAKGNTRWVRLTCNVQHQEGKTDRLFGVLQDVSEQRGVLERMRLLAECDSLTGLPNRSVLQQKISAAADGRDGGALTLILIDMDGFKHVNDTFGQQVGDECLKRIADRIRRASLPTDLVVRMGGDEFALLVRSADRRTVEKRVARVLRELRRPVRWRGKSFQLSGSIGVAFQNATASNLQHLDNEADMALYAAKAAGRNTFRVFDPDMKRRAEARFETVRNISRALKQGQLELFYQPKVSLPDQVLAGYEALLRWRHPDGRVIAAGAFSAALEDPDLSDRIGDWVVAAALSQARTWHRAGLDFGHIAINLSTSQFREVAFADRFIRQIANHGLRPEMIEVEVTEGVFLHPEGGVVRQIMEKLRVAGIRIALDDFGTGYASLSHLRSYPVDVIKLDRSFIQHFLATPKDHGIVQATLFLARLMGIDVVAEGIEEEDQREALNALGCRYGQGWLFAKALPSDEAVEWCLPASASIGHVA